VGSPAKLNLKSFFISCDKFICYHDYKLKSKADTALKASNFLKEKFPRSLLKFLNDTMMSLPGDVPVLAIFGRLTIYNFESYYSQNVSFYRL